MSELRPTASYSLFLKHRLIESSPFLAKLALQARRILRETPHAEVLIFDELSGRCVDLDRRLSDSELLAALHAQQVAATSDTEQPQSPPTPKGRGRPRLGVVAREITLLPRHWDWLASQPGGASVTLRKLVEEAKRANVGRDRIRKAQEACYRFITTMAGDWAGFEEANRALFAGDRAKFERETASWASDVRKFALRLAEPVFATAPAQEPRKS